MLPGHHLSEGFPLLFPKRALFGDAGTGVHVRGPTRPPAPPWNASTPLDSCDQAGWRTPRFTPPARGLLACTLELETGLQEEEEEEEEPVASLSDCVSSLTTPPSAAAPGFHRRYACFLVFWKWGDS